MPKKESSGDCKERKLLLDDLQKAIREMIRSRGQLESAGALEVWRLPMGDTNSVFSFR
jgi:hypothetical protein